MADPFASAPVSAPGRILATVTAAQMLSVATASVAAVALPELGRDLGADGTELQWVIDAFVLVFASLLIAGGAAGDRWGRRTALIAGLVCFGAGSLWCTLAPSVPWLLAGRVIQALGPALVLPASLAIISTTFTAPAARARAIGIWGAASGVGVMLGPLVGGALVDTVGWRGVFAFNVPVCVLLLASARRRLHRDRPPPPRHRFDAAGTTMLTAAVALLVFAVIEGRELGWGSAPVVGTAAAAAVLVAVLAVHERGHPSPVVDVTLLRHRGFVASNLGAATLYGTMTGLIVYLSVFFQQLQGRSALEAGLCLLPNGLGVALFAPLSSFLASRYGPRVPMLLGTVLAVSSLLLLLRLEPSTPVSGMWWCFGLLGAGMGTALPAMTLTAVSSVGEAQAGVAAAMHNAGRQMGQTFGVAILGTIILARAGAETGSGRLTGRAAEDWVTGLHQALLAGTAAMVLAGAAIAVLLPRSRAPHRLAGAG